MSICNLSDLMEKEVINCCDCKRLGFITDCTIQLETAKICSIIVEKQKMFCPPFKNDNALTIPWESIRKIGDDIILIDGPASLLPSPKQKKFTSK